MGDFNCHGTAWGYDNTDENGRLLEEWAESQELHLIHDPKLPASFNSSRWRRGYNPDNIFASQAIAPQCLKSVGKPIPKTQHKPIICTIGAIIKPQCVPFKRRFNFKRANWNAFQSKIDDGIVSLLPVPKNYERFVDIVKSASRKTIPRGCRTEYVPGLDDDSRSTMQRYCELYSMDPFSEETVLEGQKLMDKISGERQKKWCDMIENLDMKQNSRRAWRTLKNLSGDATLATQNYTDVTANQIASQLLINGKSGGRNLKPNINRITGENNCLQTPFTVKELDLAASTIKPNRAAGIDDLRMEQIIHFTHISKTWLVDMMNNCVRTKQIPKSWRKAMVAAIPKPGKDPRDPKNYRPISLLCHSFKLMERMILTRIRDSIDELLIPEQAGFRPSKSSCGQVLNLTEHIEKGFEEGKITGVAFIDLSAAYDTVNHNVLLTKLYNITRDYELTKMIECFLRNRRFSVQLCGKKSRWRVQKNGLPQGSVLAPLLYNIYTNDQPTTGPRRFIYADDTALAAQENTFEEVERKLEDGLEEMSLYYGKNHLRPNPTKTQVCAFHLKNHQANRKLIVKWQGKLLEHCVTPQYLGVTLDRTLTYRTHCQNTKKKVCARNNIIRKLTGSTWGAKPTTLRTSALALCISAAEYAAPVWSASAHAKEVDVAVNETARIVSGCLKHTPVDKLYPLIGIAPPKVRREVLADAERKKMEEDPRHLMHSQRPINSRLKSRHSFLKRTKKIEESKEMVRIKRWNDTLGGTTNVKEELAPGHNLPYPTWRDLNRLRTGASRCRVNLNRWGYRDDPNCDCGDIQTEDHLLCCPRMGFTISRADLDEGNDDAVRAALFWRNVT